LKYFLTSIISLIFFQLPAQYLDTSLKYRTAITYLSPNIYYIPYYYGIALDSINNDTQFYHTKDLTFKGALIDSMRIKYINGKIWTNLFNYNDRNAFQFMYDFNRKQGEKIRFSASFFVEDSAYIDSVRSIQLNNKKYTAQYLSNGHILVDSLGSLRNGLIIKNWGFEQQYDLIMLCKNDELLYWRDHDLVKSGRNTCYPELFPTRIDILKNKAFTISPNPTNNAFSIHFNNNTSGTFYISNNQGQLLKRDEFDSTSDVNLENFPPGIYNVVVNINNTYYSERLVVVK